jgi:hypothetical protein
MDPKNIPVKHDFIRICLVQDGTLYRESITAGIP